MCVGGKPKTPLSFSDPTAEAGTAANAAAAKANGSRDSAAQAQAGEQPAGIRRLRVKGEAGASPLASAQGKRHASGS